jgi:hypothetical protein
MMTKTTYGTIAGITSVASQSPSLPAPSVHGAEGDFLPSNQPSATIVVPAEVNLLQGDLLIITWKGAAGDGSIVTSALPFTGADGEPYRYLVDASIIAANANRTVVLSYEIFRSSTGNWEQSEAYALAIRYVEPFTIDTSLVHLTGDGTITRTASGGTLPLRHTSRDTTIVEVPDASHGVVRGVGAGRAIVTVLDSSHPPLSASYPLSVANASVRIDEAFEDVTVRSYAEGEKIKLTTMSLEFVAIGGTFDPVDLFPPGTPTFLHLGVDGVLDVRFPQHHASVQFGSIVPFYGDPDRETTITSYDKDNDIIETIRFTDTFVGHLRLIAPAGGGIAGMTMSASRNGLMVGNFAFDQ